jgi:SAM-dependent methyltransferase
VAIPVESPAAGAFSLGGEIRRYYRAVAPFLDQELADRGDGAFWNWAAGHPPASSVLELGCGTGRATVFLARGARRVLALDLSVDLIARARQRLAGRGNVTLVAADMRELELCRRFDLVVAVDDPFVHLTGSADRELAMHAAARHLAPGGRLILDAAWFPPHRRQLAARPGGWVMERTHGSGAARLTVREQWQGDPGSRLFTARYSYGRRGETLAESSFRARLWSVAELRQRCRAAGLEVLSLWGDYDRRPWSRATSPRLIVEARR